MPDKKRKHGIQPGLGEFKREEVLDRPANRELQEEVREPGRECDREDSSGEESPAGEYMDLIVGIGASAGGLEALSDFLDNIPKEFNFCIVIAQHRGRQKDQDMLGNLLGQHTTLRVVSAEDGMPLKQGVVHLLPPETIAHIEEGAFDIRPKEPREMVIDHFLSSLARAAGRLAVAVVLSGSNSDGTQGAKEVRAHAGLVLVQDPQTATHEIMPKSVIDEGLADDVLSPAEMPGRILEYATHLEQGSGNGGKAESEVYFPPKVRERLLQVLESNTGHDFSLYKANTVNRRIRRRMDVHRFSSLKKYVNFLRFNQEEPQELFRELLIGVTHFFRDPQAWETLSQVLAKQYLHDFERREFRAWVPACSSGEEAYTLAMVLREATQNIKPEISVSVFASDLDERAIIKARKGIFPANIAQDLDEARLDRYFINIDNHFTVRRELREKVVFTVHNILKDPPFSNLDLICCRNLLMYLTPTAQSQVLSRFQYGLRPGGLLFLGTAESVSSHAVPFETLESKWRVFALKPNAKPAEVPPSNRPAYRHATMESEGMTPPRKSTKTHVRSDLQRFTERQLLEKACPPSLLVTRSGDILYIHGRTGPYLELSPGDAGTNVLNMAREGLRAALSEGLDQAAAEIDKNVQRNIKVRTNGSHTWVDIHVHPAEAPNDEQQYFLISFLPSLPLEERDSRADTLSESEATGRIRELEHELRHTRQNLRTVIEDYEAANEELESSNEELQSTNEELKSTNEELETSREELESINEEQSTLNDELQAKNQELAVVNDDMANLLASTRVATLFLDEKLEIKRYTPAMQEFMGVRDQDIGRPVQDISLHLDYSDLARDAKRVLDNLDSLNREVRNEAGSWFQLRISPYRTTENVIAGVVLTLNDISEVKRKEREAQEARLFSENIIDTINEPLLVLNDDFTVRTANKSFYRAFKYKRHQTENLSLFELGDGHWNNPELRKLLNDIIPEKKEVHDFEITIGGSGAESKHVWINAKRVLSEVSPTSILLVIKGLAPLMADVGKQ